MNQVPKPSQCIVAGVLRPAQAGGLGGTDRPCLKKWSGEEMWSSQCWFGEQGAEPGKDSVSVLGFRWYRKPELGAVSCTLSGKCCCILTTLMCLHGSQQWLAVYEQIQRGFIWRGWRSVVTRGQDYSLCSVFAFKNFAAMVIAWNSLNSMFLKQMKVQMFPHPCLQRLKNSFIRSLKICDKLCKY